MCKKFKLDINHECLVVGSYYKFKCINNDNYDKDLTVDKIYRVKMTGTIIDVGVVFSVVSDRGLSLSIPICKFGVLQ